MAVAATRRRQAPRMSMGLPCGRRVTRGNVRWYLLRVREGAELSTSEKLLKLLPKEVLSDCFVLRKERWFKRAGVWSLQLVNAYKGYVFAVTDDPAALYKALSRLSMPVEIAGADGRAWMPLASEAQEWFERCMDERHVLGGSTAVIEGGVLHVTEGPLVGQEGRIRNIDRHRRRCMVEVADEGDGFSELMAIDVPFKS